MKALRNIAIIAHVDHGKTTLVDCLLQQSGTLDRKNAGAERIMDSNDQERERGITILAKNTAINWNDYRINIVDTPGHADFGGEVERVLSMVDSVLLLVDAVDGPMPQTRFVTAKAFERGLNPIVVVNKVDRPGARPDWVVDQVFDLFDTLGATEEQLDFPVIYASAINGVAGEDFEDMATDMSPLFKAIVDKVAPPEVNADGAEAGDIVCVTGIDTLNISDTLCDPAAPEALPALTVDEPTVSMTFQVNDSPFAGREGKYVTSRNIKERLERELIHNVALRVEQGDSPDKFKVSGRGELHLSVLIENMRREGFELGVSRPEVIQKEIDGKLCEPYEQLVIDCEEAHQGGVMEELGLRRAELQHLVTDGAGRVRLEFIVPARGLIGFRSQFLTLTSGSGIMTHVFDHYGPVAKSELGARNNGVLVSMISGKTLAYALFSLQERGRLFIEPNVDVYEGQIMGLHSRGNDLVVNPTKAKQLTNVRASGTDEAVILTPPVLHSLEQALEFIDEDELVEVTPDSMRLRKKLLLEHERKRASRNAA